MTMKKFYTVNLRDSLAVVLECKKCHTSTSYPITDWKRTPFRCSNCSGVEMVEHTTDWKTLESFRESLKRFLDTEQTLPFEVKLEFEATVRNDLSQ